MKDAGAFLPVGDAAHRQATPAELQLIDDDIEKGLGRGALAVGMASTTPLLPRRRNRRCIRPGGKIGASVHVHLRHAGLQEPTTGLVGIEEVIAAPRPRERRSTLCTSPAWG